MSHGPAPTLHRVTIKVTLPRDPAQHAARLRLIEEVLCNDDRVELFAVSTNPLPLTALTRFTPGGFGWSEPKPNSIGQPEVSITVLIHCPDTGLHSTRVVLMHWVEGFRFLRLGQLHAQSQEILPQTSGLHHQDARAATAA